MRRVVTTDVLTRRIVSAELRCPDCKAVQRVRADSRETLRRYERIPCPNCQADAVRKALKIAAKEGTCD